MKSKKQLILWVLNILNTESDADKPITQTKIAEKISDVYPCDRKTVCRNIKFLKEMGYPIVKTQKGFYIEGMMFSRDEVEFVRTAILSADGKNEDEKSELAEKVTSVLIKMRRK